MGPEEKKAMQSHLEDGCKECSKVFGAWKGVRDVARHESSYHPPESLVRTVKGMGAIFGLTKSRQGKPLIARLLFDSSRCPLPAGVRSSPSIARQLLYGAGDYQLDLRIEPREDSDKISLVGQILNSSEPDQAVGAVPVVILKGQKILAQCVTNRFGEFQVDCSLESSLQLRAGLPRGQAICIRLIEPTGRGFDAKPDVADSIGLKGFLRGVKKSTRKKA